MARNSSVAANLKPGQRKKLFLEMQSSDQTITAIANREGVSRKFLHQQDKRGHKALAKEFSQSKEDSDILYWIPVTKEWIFQVILGLIFICHSSYYCYLLVGAEHRDEDTWGWHLLEASKQGLNPDFSIADALMGLRAGHESAWPGKPCHGDTFHILHKTVQIGKLFTQKSQSPDRTTRKT